MRTTGLLKTQDLKNAGTITALSGADLKSQHIGSGGRTISGSRSFCFTLSWRLAHASETVSKQQQHPQNTWKTFLSSTIMECLLSFLLWSFHNRVISHLLNPWGQPRPLLSKPPRTVLPLALTTLSNAHAFCNIQVRSQTHSSCLCNDFIFCRNHS